MCAKRLLLIAGFCVLLVAGCASDDGTGEKTSAAPPTSLTAIDGAPFEGVNIRNVVFGNNTFVATGEAGHAWHSPDGIAWTASEDREALGADSLSGLAFGNGKFLVAGGASGNTVRAYSDDGGVAWKSSGTGINCKGVAYGNGLYLTGGGGGRLAWSADPATPGSWTLLTAEETTFNTGNGYINAIAFGDGIFVAAGSDRGHAAYSANGVYWTGITQTEEVFGGWINGIAYGNGRFVAVGDNGKAAYTTTSPNDWIAIVDTALPSGDAQLTPIAYGNGYFVMGNRAGEASWSADGIIWTLIADTTFIDKESGINGITYGNGKFVLAGANGVAAYATVE
jgi:WD40 repeat protein